MFLRDGASAGVKACRDLGLRDMLCLAHYIHLVVGAGISRRQGDRDVNYFSDTDFEVGGGEADDFLVGSRVVRSDHDKVRAVVNVFRKLAVYFKRSSKGQNRLKALQTTRSHPLVTIVDSPTRWESTLSMLSRMLELRSALMDFYGYLAQREGIAEFRDIRRSWGDAPVTEQ
ncbi:hypothetical protein PybrP1_000388 [[Pythium] brassicae (nom. inval.)]|nr:hypothetical protein PybrP1_000388 [[Pythium] brassicae (nom. inval.)]